MGIAAWQAHRKHRPLAQRAIDSDRTAQRHSHVTHHRQAYAHPLAHLLGSGATEEGLKHMGHIGLTDAYAIVGHADNQHVVFDARGNRDLAEVITIGNGVLDQASHYFVQVVRHDVDFGRLLTRHIGEFDLPAHTLLAITLHQHAQIGHRIACMPVGILDGTAHTTHHQDVIHQREQAVALTLDDVHVAVQRRLVAHVAQDAVGSAHDGRQRRAQLMHHIGKE